jgi:endogenous inhibitor of DNA gyrase (YacG/DUF329 family)
MSETRCATCKVALPSEPDPRTVVYCSPRCYAREAAAVPIVHVIRPAGGESDE